MATKDMATRNTGLGWGKLELLGIVVVALGAAFLAYSVYSFFSTPTSFAGSLPAGFNATAAGSFPGGASGNFVGRRGNFTGTGAPSTTSFSRYSGEGILSRSGDIISGVLMLLLGVVLFKYGGLRKQLKSR